MRAITSCSGQDLVDMFNCAAVWLDTNVPHINSLNVFPVPDGDTGINMSLTMRSAMAEASPYLLEPIYEVAVEVPEAFMCDITGDLNSRRGRDDGRWQRAKGKGRSVGWD